MIKNIEDHISESELESYAQDVFRQLHNGHDGKHDRPSQDIIKYGLNKADGDENIQEYVYRKVMRTKSKNGKDTVAVGVIVKLKVKLNPISDELI